MKINDISRNGIVTIGFNQKLKIPYFIQNITERNGTDFKGRGLVSIEDIDVEEILQIEYVMRQNMDPKKNNFTYSLVLKEWKPTYLKMEMDISKPLLVSQGDDSDQIILNILDKPLF